MKYLAFALVVFFIQDIPYKAKDEFDVKLDYKFKIRPAQERTWAASDNTHRSTEALLPYLILDIKVLKVSARELKVRIIDNKNSSSGSRRVTEGTTIPVVIGFTDDAKDRVTAHEYQVIFIDEARKPVSRIHFFIEDNGTFYVNGEKHGKF